MRLALCHDKWETINITDFYNTGVNILSPIIVLSNKKKNVRFLQYIKRASRHQVPGRPGLNFVAVLNPSCESWRYIVFKENFWVCKAFASGFNCGNSCRRDSYFHPDVAIKRNWFIVLKVKGLPLFRKVPNFFFTVNKTGGTVA